MDTGSTMLQMILSLAAVVAMILGLAWMTRRMQNLRGTQSGELRVRASLAVGLKERVVIVEALGQQFLIGVAPGQVSILKALGSCKDGDRPDAVWPIAECPTALRDQAKPKRNPGLAFPESGPPDFGAVAPQSRLRESFAYQLRQLLGR